MSERWKHWIGHDGTEGTPDWFRFPDVSILPKGWKLIRHTHLNNGEGYGADPYDVDVYEDENGVEHNVFAGTFNIEASRPKLQV